MMRVRVVGTGWTGGPGLNTFYFENTTLEDNAAAALAVARVRAAFAILAAVFHTSTTYNVDPNVDVLQPITGEVTNTLQGGSPAAVVGTANFAGGIFPPATAVVMQIQTATFLAGRRLRGRAFLSPLSANLATVTGFVSTLLHDKVVEAGTLLLDKGATEVEMVIWRRPVVASEGPPAIAARPGTTGIATAVTCGAGFATLRSRRD